MLLHPQSGDQEACHIISVKNDGASHSSNLFLLSRGYNRATGARQDPITCFLAGLRKTEMAVAASKKYAGYNGPSAYDLYEQGQQVFQKIMCATK